VQDAGRGTLGIVMDWQFWVGLALGIPLSIAANIWTDRVRDFLDKRRTIRLSNKKSKEVQTYLYVRSLREGDATAKVMFDIGAINSLRELLFGLFGLVTIVFIVMAASDPKLSPYKTYIGYFSFFLIFLVTGFMTLSLIQYWRLLQIRRRLRWFREYENGIREKWGDDAIEEFLQPQIERT
jgi:hypothetical protein